MIFINTTIETVVILFQQSTSSFLNSDYVIYGSQDNDVKSCPEMTAVFVNGYGT